MLLSKEVAAVSLLIAAFDAISARPLPGVIRERHIIHAPIKFRFVHHYNIKKVPIIIKKHLHYYKPQEADGHFDENRSNHIYNSEEHYNEYEFDRPLNYKTYHPGFLQSGHRAPEDGEDEEEEYDEAEQSQEEQEYEEYEHPTRQCSHSSLG